MQERLFSVRTDSKDGLYAFLPVTRHLQKKLGWVLQIGGDHAGYRTQIKALASRHPDTLVADQAAMVADSTPAIGPGTALLSAIALRAGLKYIAR